MNEFKQCCLALTLVTNIAFADSELYIRYDAINVGDTKQKILAILGTPTSEDNLQVLGMSCEQLVFKQSFLQEETKITLCFNRVIAKKYAARSLLGF